MISSIFFCFSMQILENYFLGHPILTVWICQKSQKNLKIMTLERVRLDQSNCYTWEIEQMMDTGKF